MLVVGIIYFYEIMQPPRPMMGNNPVGVTMQTASSMAQQAPKPAVKSSMLQKTSSIPRQPMPPRANTFLLRLNCMYTKQINKKRKIWSDGLLKVAIDGESIHVTLVNAEDPRQLPLDSRQLEPSEVQRFKTRTGHEIQLENYIVDVSFDDNSSTSTATNAVTAVKPPPLKLPKFVPPARVVPAAKENTNNSSQSNMGNNNNRYPPSSSATATNAAVSGRSYGNSRSAYQISDNELDDIWGAKPSQPSTYPQSSSAFSNNQYEDSFDPKSSLTSTNNRPNPQPAFNKLQSSNVGFKLVQTSLQSSSSNKAPPRPSYHHNSSEQHDSFQSHSLPNASSSRLDVQRASTSSFLQDNDWDDLTHNVEPITMPTYKALDQAPTIQPAAVASDDWGEGWGEFGADNNIPCTSSIQPHGHKTTSVTTSFEIDDSIWFN